MFVGTRHRQGPSAGLPAFVSMSVIALLALVCFPVFAQAEDSAGTQYTDALPKPEGNNSPTKKKQPVAKTADNGGASVPKAKTAPGEEKADDGSGEGESSEKDGAGAGAGKDDGTGQGSPGSSAKDAGENAAQSNPQATSPSASETSEDGSSPLVPILLIILVLAAISLAVVMIKQRRQRGPTTPASEAS